MTTDSPCQRCRKARENCTIGLSISTGLPKDRPGRLSLDNGVPSSTHSSSPSRSARLVLPHQGWEPADTAGRQNDALVGTEVNWLDMLDNTCDIPCDLDSAPAVTGTTEDYDTDLGGGTLTITPASQNTGTGAYPFSVPDDFELSPSFDISGGGSPSAPEKDFPDTQMNQQSHSDNAVSRGGDVSSLEQVSSNIRMNTQSHKDIPVRMNGLLSNMSTHAQDNTMALNFNNRALAPRTPSSSGSSSQASHRNESNRPTAELKDELIQELSDLSTSLMKDLHRIVGCKLISSFLLTRSNDSPAEYLFKTLDGSTSQENAIGRMLQGSEKFLEIMQLFTRWFQSVHPFPDDSLGGEGLGSNLEGKLDNSKGNSEAWLEKRWSILQSYLERQRPIPAALTSESFGIAQKPDITAKLAVLTCYTCLLRIYETVFFVIHHTMEYSPSLAAAIKLPQMVPGLEINGFMLNEYRSLQIKVLIQVSTYMLDSVENTMQCMLSDPAFQALLKTVLQQEGLECAPGNETGKLKP